MLTTSPAGKSPWDGEGPGLSRGTTWSRPGACVLTLRNLCGQWRGDGDEVALPAAIVDRHLAPLAQVVHVAVALGHKLFQGVVPIHQHTCGGRRQRLVGVGDPRGQTNPVGVRGQALPAQASISICTVMELGESRGGKVDAQGTRQVHEQGEQTRKHRPVSR